MVILSDPVGSPLLHDTKLLILVEDIDETEDRISFIDSIDTFQRSRVFHHIPVIGIGL